MSRCDVQVVNGASPRILWEPAAQVLWDAISNQINNTRNLWSNNMGHLETTDQCNSHATWIVMCRVVNI